MNDQIRYYSSDAGTVAMYATDGGTYQVHCYTDDGAPLCSYEGDFAEMEQRWAYHALAVGASAGEAELSVDATAIAIAS